MMFKMNPDYIAIGTSTVGSRQTARFAQKRLNELINIGITKIDTSPLYGGGAAEKILMKSGTLSNFEVTTKVGLYPSCIKRFMRYGTLGLYLMGFRRQLNFSKDSIKPAKNTGYDIISKRRQSTIYIANSISMLNSAREIDLCFHDVDLNEGNIYLYLNFIEYVKKNFNLRKVGFSSNSVESYEYHDKFDFINIDAKYSALDFIKDASDVRFYSIFQYCDSIGLPVNIFLREQSNAHRTSILNLFSNRVYSEIKGVL